VNNLERDIRQKDDMVKKMNANIEYARNEIQRINESIIDLTEKENQLEDIIKMRVKEHNELSTELSRIEKNIHDLS